MTLKTATPPQRLDRANNPLPRVERPRITTLQLFFGYCESQRMAGVVIAREGTKGFKTARGALRCFLRDCKSVIQKQSDESTKPCCVKAMGTSTYCPKCGKRLKTEPEEVDADTLAEWVQELDSDLDGIGSETLDALADRGWVVGSSKAGDRVEVHGMDYLIRGEYKDCWSVERRQVGEPRYIAMKAKNPLDL